MYGYRYYSSSGAAALLGFLAAVVSLIFLVLMVYWIISYIFSSIAYYKISKRRGYQRPWLAWIPFARNYLYGAIADDINIKRGKKTYFGWILLVLNAPPVRWPFCWVTCGQAGTSAWGAI